MESKTILTTNIKKDAVGFDHVSTFPTDLIKPVIGLIPVPLRKKIYFK